MSGDLLRIQWLQKIIHRLQSEGVRGAVRVSRRKDQTRRLRQHGQLRRQRDTVFARQIDVNQDRVWPQLGGKAQTRPALCGRTDHLYLTGLVEQFRQVLRSQGLVFDK